MIPAERHAASTVDADAVVLTLVAPNPGTPGSSRSHEDPIAEPSLVTPLGCVVAMPIIASGLLIVVLWEVQFELMVAALTAGAC